MFPYRFMRTDEHADGETLIDTSVRCGREAKLMVGHAKKTSLYMFSLSALFDYYQHKYIFAELLV
jgi:hypothetical protein